jgi:hypothetical protein
LRDDARQCVVADRRTAPHFVEQPLFGDKLAGVPQQKDKQIERLRLERDHVGAFAQPAFRHVEGEFVERVDLGARHA